MTQSLSALPAVRQLWLRAAFIQMTSVFVAGVLAWWLGWSLGAWLVVTVMLAGWLTYQSELPRWWLLIQMLFFPALLWINSLAWPPWLFLILFGVLFAIFGGVFSSRVPLYLTGKKTCEELEKIMPVDANFYFLDLGCGTGSVLRYLDSRFPFGMFHGVETAPLPFVMAWLRSKLGAAQFQVKYQNLWQADLSHYDVVYAFLSPQPMAELWHKVQREMRPNSLFISNSFAVPDVVADQIIELHDGRATRLYVWRLRATSQEAV